MRLVLHVGSAKTGTTSIQTSLQTASPALLKRGVLYPVIDRRKNHNLLAAPFKQAINKRMLLRFGSEEAFVTAAMRHFHELGNLLQKYKPHTLVLSAEFLFREIDARAFMEHLHASAPEIEDVQIAMYLRQPSHYYLSRLQQRLKSTPQLASPARVDLASVAGKWTNHGRLQFREFARTQLVDADAVRDFWHCFLPGELCPFAAGSLRENTSLSAESLCLLRQYYLAVGSPDKHESILDSDLLVRRLQKLETIASVNTTRPRLHDDIVRFLDAPCEDLTELRNVHGFEFAAVAGRPSTSEDVSLPDRNFDQIGDFMSFSPEKLQDLRRRLIASWCMPGSMAWRQNRELSKLQHCGNV